MIQFLDSLAKVISESLSKLDSIISLLFSVFIIVITVLGFVLVYIYKQMRSDSKAYAAERNSNFTSLISVHEKTSENIGKMAESMQSLSKNIELNSKVTENLSTLIITKLL